MDQVGAEPVVLFAYFYSGHVAVRYAVKHPERVRALILVTQAHADHRVAVRRPRARGRAELGRDAIQLGAADFLLRRTIAVA